MRAAIRSYMGMIAIAIAAVLVIGAIGVRIDRSQTPEVPAGIAATPLATQQSAYLVDAPWLVANTDEIDYLFDLGDARMYEQGHIPGAHHIWWQDAMALHVANYGEPDQISQVVDINDVFGRLNLQIPQDARVVLYDSNDSARASWLLWVMQLNGYTNVQVLDGGLAAWIGAGGDVTTDAPAARDAGVAATPTINERVQIRHADLVEQANKPDLRLVDTRSAEQMADTVNGTVREGHIPGSINIPTADVISEDGTFRSVEELQAIFAQHGLDPDNEIVVYGLFSPDSATVWLALRSAGYENAVIYREGFVAWAYDESLPLDPNPHPAFTPAASPAATPIATPIASPVSSPGATPEDGPTDLTGD